MFNFFPETTKAKNLVKFFVNNHENLSVTAKSFSAQEEKVIIKTSEVIIALHRIGYQFQCHYQLKNGPLVKIVGFPAQIVWQSTLILTKEFMAK